MVVERGLENMINDIHNFGIEWNDLDPIVKIGTSENMDGIEDDSVDLVVTSPPYGTVKDYGYKDQIGFGSSFFEYYTRMRKVIEECKRVSKFGARIIINIGDQYMRKGEYSKRYRIEPIAYKITSICDDIGLEFLGDIIWKKISNTSTSGGCSFMGSIFYPRKGMVTYDYEHILIFRNVSGKKQEINKGLKEYSKISIEEWKKWFVGHWNISPARQDKHCAMFPEEIPYRIIRMFSIVGDTVLDPFAGSGTTLKVAKSLLRKSIGFEMNPDFVDLIRDKVSEATPFLFFDHQTFYNLLSSKYNMDIDFSSGKGITCIRNENGDGIVLDFETFPNEIDIEKKVRENNFKNFENGKGDWDTISKYVVVLNSRLSDVGGKMVKGKKKDIGIVTLGAITSNKLDLFKL
jgi:DNA modification methylase